MPKSRMLVLEARAVRVPEPQERPRSTAMTAVLRAVRTARERTSLTIGALVVVAGVTLATAPVAEALTRLI